MFWCLLKTLKVCRIILPKHRPPKTIWLEEEPLVCHRNRELVSWRDWSRRDDNRRNYGCPWFAWEWGGGDGWWLYQSWPIDAEAYRHVWYTGVCEMASPADWLDQLWQNIWLSSSPTCSISAVPWWKYSGQLVFACHVWMWWHESLYYDGMEFGSLNYGLLYYVFCDLVPNFMLQQKEVWSWV